MARNGGRAHASGFSDVYNGRSFPHSYDDTSA
jgi:hypothetical protein